MDARGPTVIPGRTQAATRLLATNPHNRATFRQRLVTTRAIRLDQVIRPQRLRTPENRQKARPILMARQAALATASRPDSATKNHPQIAPPVSTAKQESLVPSESIVGQASSASSLSPGAAWQRFRNRVTLAYLTLRGGRGMERMGRCPTP